MPLAREGGYPNLPNPMPYGQPFCENEQQESYDDRSCEEPAGSRGKQDGDESARRIYEEQRADSDVNAASLFGFRARDLGVPLVACDRVQRVTGCCHGKTLRPAGAFSWYFGVERAR
jgi:hypothetical protein